MANEPRFCAVEEHNVRYSMRDNVRPLTIKTFCFAVAHFCCMGNFTFYLVNITLYCFVTVSLKELFGLFFQSIVDFKPYERNNQRPYKPFCGMEASEQTKLSECAHCSVANVPNDPLWSQTLQRFSTNLE